MPARIANRHRHRLALAAPLLVACWCATLGTAQAAAPLRLLPADLQLRAVPTQAQHDATDSVSIVAALERPAPVLGSEAVTRRGDVVELHVRRRNVAAALRRLRAHPAVRYAEIGQRYLADATAPDDPSLARQWHLASIRWSPQVAQMSAARVAVIDSGLDVSHPEFAQPLANGDDRVGARYNAVTGGDDVADVSGHGTMVAGVIAAATDNALGVASVAPQAQIMPVKVEGEDGTITLGDVVRAIEWATDNGADVINLSLSSPAYSVAEHEAVERARSLGIVVVASAGNYGCLEQGAANLPQYPAALPEVIAVAATENDSEVACFSEHGPYVDIAAPGVEVFTTRTGGRYGAADGTSFSAPMVAAAAALVLSKHPTWSAEQVQQALTGSARDVGAAGWDPYAGAGVLDMQALLGLQDAPVVTDPPPQPQGPAPDTSAATPVAALPVAGAAAAPELAPVTVAQTARLARRAVRRKHGSGTRIMSLSCRRRSHARHTCRAAWTIRRHHYRGTITVWYAANVSAYDWTMYFEGRRLNAACKPRRRARCSTTTHWWLG